MPEKKKEIKVSARQLIDTYRSDQMKLEALQRRTQGLQQILNEIVLASEAIKEMQNSKKDESIMVSLGGGVYAEAKLVNTKTVKSSLAGSVLIDSKASEALSRLEEEIKKTRKELEGLQGEIQRTAQNLEGVAAILQEGQRAAMQARQSQKDSEVSSVS